MSHFRRKDLGQVGNQGQFAAYARAAGSPPVAYIDDTSGARLSRRLLIDTIELLDPFRDSLTVIGAHAVYARVERSIAGLEMPSTNDADLAVNPEFVTTTPEILPLMRSGGLEPARRERPGIYGLSSEADLPFEDRTTIDLIVPEAYAGGGRRAARIHGQKNAATMALGLEFTIHDRSEMTLTTLDGDPEYREVSAFVAGSASLIVAKAHKIRERLEQFESKPDRLRPKDSGDVGLLIMSSDAEESATVLQDISARHPEIAQTGKVAVQFVIDEYLRDEMSLVRRHLDDELKNSTGDPQRERVNTWLSNFDEATRGWRSE